jgi:hypothetical protein
VPSIANHQLLRAEALGPVEQLLVAAAISGKRAGIDTPTDRVQRDRDMDMLVVVDADDDSTPARVGLHACHCDLQLRPGRWTRRWPAGWTGL